MPRLGRGEALVRDDARLKAPVLVSAGTVSFLSLSLFFLRPLRIAFWARVYGARSVRGVSESQTKAERSRNRGSRLAARALAVCIEEEKGKQMMTYFRWPRVPLG